MNPNQDPGIDFRIYLDKFQQDIDKVNATLNKLSSQAENAGGKIDNTFKRAGQAVAGYFAVDQLAMVVGKIVSVRAEFEKYQAVLANSLGSQTEANKSMKDLAEFSARTPFQLNEITGAYVKLVNQGFKPSMEEMTKMGDLASSTGKSIDQLVEAQLDAYTGEYERLKEFGIKASKSGDQVTFTFKGVSTTVKDTSESIKNYLLSLGDIQGVSGSMAAISQTLGGSISNLGDAWDALMNNLGKQTGGAMKVAISALTGLLSVVNKAMSQTDSILSTTKLEKYEVIQDRIKRKVDSEVGSLDALFEQLKRTNPESELRKTLIEKINTEYGQYLPNMLNEKSTLVEISNAQQEANKSLMRSIALKMQQQEIEVLHSEQIKREKAAFTEIAKQTGAEVKDVKAVFDEYYDFQKSLNSNIEEQSGITGKLIPGTISYKDPFEKFNEFLKVYKVDAGLFRANLNELSNVKRITDQTIDSVISQYEGYIEDPKKFVQNENKSISIDEFKKQLEYAKNEYTNYEAVKEEIGLTKADEMYSKLMVKGKNYIEYLRALLKTPLTDEELTVVAVELQKETKSSDKGTDKQREKELKDNEEYLKQLLDDTRKADDQLKALSEKYYKDLELLRASGNYDHIDKLTEKYHKDIDYVLSSNGFYEWLYRNIDGLGRKELKAYIARIEEELKIRKAAGEKETDFIIELNKKLAEAKDRLAKLNPENIREAGQILGEMGQMLSLFNGQLGETGQLLSGVASGMDNLAVAFDETASKADKVSAGINSVINMVSMLASAANQRREAEEAYYRSVIAYQQEYNLLLNEQIRIRSEENQSVFLEDYRGSLLDASQALADANEHYQQTLVDLYNGRAKVGMRDAIDWGNVGKGAGYGAAAGATIGSVIPAVGTAIGAVVGGIVGGAIGLFGGKKSVDEYANLLQEYPELIQQGADGQMRINEELAQALINQNLVDEATKATLQSALDWQKAIDEAKQQIHEIVGELAGELGKNLENALVDAFLAGTDAAHAFGEAVSKVLENITTQMIFQAVFSNAFKQLQTDMEESWGIGGDNNVTDDFARFFEQAPALTEQFYASLAQARDMAKEYGFDILDGSGTDQSLAGSIKGMSEESANRLAGYWASVQVNIADMKVNIREQLVYAQYHLNQLESIEFNTRELKTIRKLLQGQTTNTTGNPYGV